jgi:hypothetical protein
LRVDLNGSVLVFALLCFLLWFAAFETASGRPAGTLTLQPLTDISHAAVASLILILLVEQRRLNLSGLQADIDHKRSAEPGKPVSE